VVNDGSPDDSNVIIESFQTRYPSVIRVINKQNGGLSDARNVAIDRCSGDFIWFVDSDDSIEEKCLNGVLGFLKKTTADYIIFNANRVDSYGRAIGRFQHHGPVNKETVIPFEYEPIEKYFSKHMVWLRIFRRTLIGDLRFPVGVTHEDIHFDLRLLAFEPKVIFLKDVLYRHYFDNPESITNTMSVKNAYDVLWVYSDLEKSFSCGTYESRIYIEFLKVAVENVVNRGLYLLTCKLGKKDKKRLFIDHATTACQFRKKLITYGQVLPDIGVLRRLLIFTSSKKWCYLPYWIAMCYLMVKDAYDSVSRVRGRFLEGKGTR